MSTSVAVPHTQGRTRLTALRTVLIAALVGNVLVGAVMQVQISTLIPPLAIIMVLTLVIAALCAMRWRWTPLLAVLWSVASIIPGLEPYTYSLTHPAETSGFVVTLVGLALSIIIVVAGVAATVSGERQVAEGRAPHWLTGFLVGMATFVLGASLVAAIPQAEAAAGVSHEALAQLPALATMNNRFDQAELWAKVGETVALRLENKDADGHSFDIDAFNIHAPMPAGKSALALFKPTKPGTYTFYCGVPGHTEAGMVGTLVVER
jgi:plastocyanin